LDVFNYFLGVFFFFCEFLLFARFLLCVLFLGFFAFFTSEYIGGRDREDIFEFNLFN